MVIYCKKDVYYCESYKEVVEAYQDGADIYYQDDCEGFIRRIYVNEEANLATEEDAKKAISIWDNNMNCQESVDFYGAKPEDFYIEETFEP